MVIWRWVRHWVGQAVQVRAGRLEREYLRGVRFGLQQGAREERSRHRCNETGPGSE